MITKWIDKGTNKKEDWTAIMGQLREIVGRVFTEPVDDDDLTLTKLDEAIDNCGLQNEETRGYWSS